jgi:DNA-binding response OmpR family regulator
LGTCPTVAGSLLEGEAILLVEEQPLVGRALQTALESAGAGVVIAQNGREALLRIEQYDFSAAILDWQPDSREQRTVVHWFEDAGIRFLFCADGKPDDITPARGAPILIKPSAPEDVIRTLASLLARPKAGPGRI